MEEWHLKRSDLKIYPHFDPLISAEDGEAYATDKDRVARHAFFPFIQDSQRWTRFAKKGEKGPVKERPIRYAARRDAYIFSYYRHLLSQRYEAELARLGLEASILAYRRIPISDGRGAKCNIHFAHDAFLRIRELADCCAVALDVSAFFESLDHARLKDLWCRMLGVARLPTDHFQVFKAITQYCWVEKKELYERLGHFGEKTVLNGEPIKGYLTPYKKVPRHLCDGRQFREQIAGSGARTSIIKKNYKPYGIPQGSPISDLLANLYLIDFDSAVAGWVGETGGTYFRYSDDILIIAPGGETVGRDLMSRTRDLICGFGAKLEIKESKSSLLVFERQSGDQKFQLLHGTQGRNGLEYLGFRYDGSRVYLRDATLSNLRRKVARAACRAAEACARRYPDKDAATLRKLLDYEALFKKFGKVEGFDEMPREYRSWTFWTYAKRASKVFGLLGKPILRQLRKQRPSIRWRADKALERAVIRRDRRKATRHR
jgi:Reverse transcriptase (RNA-dependent DNA polymerase)